MSIVTLLSTNQLFSPNNFIPMKWISFLIWRKSSKMNYLCLLLGDDFNKQIH